MLTRREFQGIASVFHKPSKEEDRAVQSEGREERYAACLKRFEGYENLTGAERREFLLMEGTIC